MRTVFGILTLILVVGMVQAEEQAEDLSPLTTAKATDSSTQAANALRDSSDDTFLMAQDTGEPSDGQLKLAGEKQWEFDFRVNGWMVSIDGDVTVKGVESHMDVDFLDILSDIEWILMGRLEVRRDKWGGFFDGVYAELKTDADTVLSAGPVDIDVDIDIEMHLAILEFGVFYELLDRDVNFLGGRHLTGAPYVGGRYVSLDADIDFDSSNSSLNVSGDQDWFDLIIGWRTRLQISDKWALNLDSNIGGFDIGDSSDFSHETTILFGYDMTKRSTLLLGYRYLHIDYDDGSGSSKFEFDAEIKGPLVAVNIHF